MLRRGKLSRVVARASVHSISKENTNRRLEEIVEEREREEEEGEEGERDS